MNNGNYRRNRKRYKVRYDRVFAAVLVLIVLIVLITACTKGCSDDEQPAGSQNSVVDNLAGSTPQSTDALGQVITDPNAANQNAGGAPAANPNAAAQTTDPNAAAQFTTQDVEFAQVNNGDLVLVNSLYAYKFQEGDTNIVPIYENRNEFYSVSDNITSLDLNTITAINSIMQAYAGATGNDYLRIYGGYRTAEEQTTKYNEAKSKFPGGYSDYHTGRTFDVQIVFPDGTSNAYSPTDTYAWFNENAASYGFIVRFPEGKDAVTGEEARAYTFRYVGIPHAVYMKQNNLCLEEYIEQIKAYNNTNPLRITSGTSQYEVYYVAANPNSVTGVPVPASKPYTISGNNIDGFIVTVTAA